ncbi:MAG TPA: methyltransferase [Candidatus Binatia bacterium]
MSSRQKTDITRKPRYDRKDTPHLSELVAAIERKHDAIKAPLTLTLEGHTLVVEPGVFNPEFSMMGRLLAQAIAIGPGATVLDLGTGTGFQAIVAAKRAGRVLAVDRQPEAVRCARQNVEMNGLAAMIEVRQSDLFSSIRAGERFDVILFNVPFPPWKPETPWQEANFDEGHRLLERFIKQAKGFLHPGGRIGMTWSDIGDTDYFHALLDAEGFHRRVVVRREIQGVGQYIYELSPKGPSAPGH